MQFLMRNGQPVKWSIFCYSADLQIVLNHYRFHHYSVKDIISLLLENTCNSPLSSLTINILIAKFFVAFLTDTCPLIERI